MMTAGYTGLSCEVQDGRRSSQSVDYIVGGHAVLIRIILNINSKSEECNTHK
ncbi:hypothetical protein HanPI659440_Chr04g0166471 [Helianthus annuus]|nr:hypothetical protein HanPI659440_Chr04g0166471 [Helianthus annuus]